MYIPKIFIAYTVNLLLPLQMILKKLYSSSNRLEVNMAEYTTELDAENEYSNDDIQKDKEKIFFMLHLKMNPIMEKLLLRRSDFISPLNLLCTKG